MEKGNELDNIQENLYSRQIGTYGEEAMKKILQLKILILGVKGIGIEIAKNIILTGPERVVIYDPDIVELKDLGTNFYLKEEDINKNRIDYSCLKSLTELNQYTQVDVLNLRNSNELYIELPKNNFDIIIQTEIKPLNEIILLNEYCRKKNIKFIYGTALGLSGFIFCDFGKEHTILDQNGIEPQKFLCKNITNSEKGLVTIEYENDNPFNLDTDDYIIFKNVKGMIELNDNKPRKITLLEDNMFSIEDDTLHYHKFGGNGDVYEYKASVKKQYISFQESINLPFNKKKIEDNFTEQQEIKLHKNKLYLSLFLAISEYLDNKNNSIKDLNNDVKITIISKNAEIKFKNMIQHEAMIGFNYEEYEDNEIQHFDMEIAYNIIKFSQYKIAPICSIIGGYISQEIIKVTGKYIPINQWMFFDLYDYKHKYGIINNIKKLNSRYYDQISIFGDIIQEKIEKQKIFVSGAGAVGCELLKNAALIGLSTDKDGLLTITDYDNIENSNLNRQFLFNRKNVNQSKSIVACESIKKMNKNINCTALHKKVCEETENYFNEKFWKNQDIIISAVDDDKARLYLNNKCFKYNKILLNVGTSGVRAKANIVIPKVTYPLPINTNNNKKELNMCTVKKFPSKIEHCVKWSNDLFDYLFSEKIKIYNKFIMNKNQFLEELLKEPDDVFIDKYKIIKTIVDIVSIKDEESKNYKILELSIYYFYLLYTKSIENLLLIYPPDRIDDGILFWSGSRKKPYPFKSIDINDKMTKQFLYSFCFIFSNCLKKSFKIKLFEDNIKLNKLIQDIFKVFEMSNNQIIINDEKEKKIKMNEIIKEINLNNTINGIINEEIFEKDGLTNNHIEFIQSSANLRARNYSIDEESKNKILMISGKIIASVPTSTASVVGYLSLQLINLMYTRDIENVLKNSYLHLGLNIFDLIPQEKYEENEIEEKKKEIEERKTNYPELIIKGSKTCKEFLEYMKNDQNLEVIHFEINNKILYDKRVTKDPVKIKKEFERSQKKIEDLYYEQLQKTNNINEISSNKELMIKIHCRTKNEENNIIENIYDFPLIKYLLD